MQLAETQAGRGRRVARSGALRATRVWPPAVPVAWHAAEPLAPVPWEPVQLPTPPLSTLTAVWIAELTALALRQPSEPLLTGQEQA